MASTSSSFFLESIVYNQPRESTKECVDDCVFVPANHAVVCQNFGIPVLFVSSGDVQVGGFDGVERAGGAVS